MRPSRGQGGPSFPPPSFGVRRRPSAASSPVRRPAPSGPPSGTEGAGPPSGAAGTSRVRVRGQRPCQAGLLA
ncbi:hypothetical protein STXM2123_1651 [Streptomyces sp. F-3]|nr:hypothetical protein STXM2123_1651 [Streptomyces sp. F-3]